MKTGSEIAHLPWVVGIGSSAGGLEAVTLFISNIGPGFEGAFILAQHLAPKSKSMMVELLARHTDAPVVTAENAQLLEAGTFYVIPPNVDAEVNNGRIVLTEAGPETRPKPSVDLLFSSLARNFGERAVGIILSGTGSDGSEGIRDIRAVRGVTIAQDGKSAKYDGMPVSALQTGSVDTVLSPEEIAHSLEDILRAHTARSHEKVVEKKQVDAVLNLLKRNGRDFTEYKMSTIRRRLAKRMAQVGSKTVADYMTLLEKTPGEIGQLSQELLVSVTTFFRDTDAWEELKKLISRMYDAKPFGSELRVWIAGCATGEEAYSIGMVLADLQAKRDRGLSIKVFATDLDQDAILEARNAVYSEHDVANVSHSFRQQFLIDRGGGKFEVAKVVRDLVVFARQDLVQSPPFVKLDLITCRNVLIYFEATLQKRVIETFHYALVPSGYLFLGSSETPVGCGHLYETIDRKNRIFEKINVPSNAVLSTKVSKSAMPDMSVPGPQTLDGKNPMFEQGYARLIDAYGMAGVIIDKDGTMVHVLGNIAPYTKITSGQADFRLPNLMPRGVGLEIPILISKVMKDRAVHRSRIHGEQNRYRIAIRPLASDDDSRSKSLFLVNFEPVEKVDKLHEPVLNATIEADLPERFSELERELFQTREHLQTLIEELGVSNEELQSLNEELSSTNEELQASNEELETTNEELQSSNEELTTVNEELAVKTAELRSNNTELHNVYASIGSPLVVIDAGLAILRYNENALRIFNLTASTSREDITKVSTNFEIADFKLKLNQAIKKGISTETICESPTAIFQLRCVPFYDDSRRIVGAILIFFDNTAAIRIQRQLHTSEGRVSAIINSSTSLISLKDSVGRYILANKAFADFFGLGVEQITGKTDRELFSDSVASEFRDGDLEVLHKRESFQREETLHARAGENRMFLINRFPLFELGQTDAYAVGTIAVDITPQVEAQKALQESETRYRAIVEEQSVFVCRTKQDGTLVYTNTSFNQFFSGSGRVTPTRFYDIVVEDDKMRVHAFLEEISPAQPIVQYDHRYRSVNQGERWIRWIHRGIFNAKGEATEFQAVGFDVTETKNQTDQLIEKEAVFKSLFSNTSDFIAVFRVMGSEIVLESLNRSAEKAFGFAHAQLIGRRLQDFVDPQHENEVVSRYRAAIESGTAQVVDEDTSLMGTRKRFLTTIVPIPGPSGDVERVAAMSRDVSAYKAIEMDLRQAKQTADVANRAKSDFLASMSHELRTPLNVVLGMAHLLAESRLDQEQKEYVGSISRSGQLLLSLIEDVLDISKIESGKVRLNAQPFKISDVAKEISELFSVQAAEKGIAISVFVERDADVYVLGDVSRVRQIIVNLVGNAIKFTDHGKVELSIRTEGHEIAGEQMFRFKVVDTGLGIRQEFHDKIFQKFSQAESGDTRRYGGSGLGLVISKHLTSLMHGEIGFESRYGEGSTFWFTVRLQLTTKQEIEERSRRLQDTVKTVQWEHRPLRILAVDDNQESLNVARLFLKRLGHDAVTARGGRDAISKLKQSKFDLVLMDIQMPEMDGLEATKIIRGDNPEISNVPIIALTANAMSGDADRCFAAGMNDYLSKPIQMTSLKAMIARWAQRLVPANGENVNGNP